ncbi:MAG: hypothetical protein NTW10_00875 [Bacteroidetes bacterium]|nr:hypothetical protein [Bacteroidota bacterium]
MKTVKFNEEEVELLIALYEDELKEAGAYIDKLRQTLDKLKKQAESTKPEPARTGKKRGRKPGKQVSKPATAGKKRGRKPRVQVASKPEVVKAEVKKAVKKRKVRKPKKQAVSKLKVQKPVKVEKPVSEEIKPV